MTGFTHVLHATDFSDPSQAACEKAVDLARQCGARLTVLHVYAHPLMAEGFAFVPDPTPELAERLSYVANEELPIAVERKLRVGIPAEQIVAFAREHHCDLIVMGTHGRTGLGHLLMGSVAENVVRHAPCPVLVVPPEPGADVLLPGQAEASRSVVLV